MNGLQRGGDQRAPVDGVATPRRVEVAPLGERTHGLAERGTRAGLALVVTIGTTKYAPHALGRGLECLLQPLVDDAVQHPHRDRLQQDLEARVDVGLDGPLTQQVGAEAVDGADVGVLEVRERVLEAVRASPSRCARACSISSRSRSFSSPAAFSVKVTATISPMRARPSASVFTIRATSSVVLPVPAAASTTSVVSRCGADAGTVVVVDEGPTGHAHFILRSSVSSASARESFRRGRDCADGPQTTAKSHQWQASSPGAAGSLPSGDRRGR